MVDETDAAAAALQGEQLFVFELNSQHIKTSQLLRCPDQRNRTKRPFHLLYTIDFL